MWKKTVTIGEDTVTKTNEPTRLRIEAEKTARAFEIGERSGLFRSPRVIDYDPNRGVLVLERLRNFTSLDRLLADGRVGAQLIEEIAAALATIHDDLNLAEDMRSPLPEELSAAGDDVCIHGDFSMKNVLATSDGQGIVILDWQMTLQHGGDATCGTRYFDVMWFVSNIFSHMCRLHLVHRDARRSIPTARRFITSYLRNANALGHEEEFVSYMRRFFAAKIVQRKREYKVKREVLGMLAHYKIQQFLNDPRVGSEWCE